MARYNLTLFGLSVFLFSHIALGQDLSNNIWNFGQNCRLDFSSGSPVPYTSAIETNEGCASICDHNGNLLFYTDGTYIYRADNSLIEGDENTLGGNSSTSQSALIVPYPGHYGQFYIFTTAAELNGGISDQFHGTTYAIFDINANSGQGALSQPVTVLLDSSAELLTGISSCDSSEYRIIAHSFPGNEFFVWKLNENGLSNPVITQIGNEMIDWYHSSAIGFIKVSNDGRKLAWSMPYTYVPRVSLFDFNFETCIISNELFKEFQGDLVYGLCFSPDNSKLYVAESNSFAVPFPFSSASVWQLNGVAETQIEFEQSVIEVVASDIHYGAIEKGPDDKLYIAQVGDNYLSVIEFPNEIGTGCGYQPNYLQLATGTQCKFGLQNTLSKQFLTSFFSSDTLYACSIPQMLSLSDISGSFQWSTGDTTQTILVLTEGLYSVDVTSRCLIKSDSVYVDFYSAFDLSLPADTILCSANTLLIEANTNNTDLQFTWNTGDYGPAIIVESSSIYFVEASNNHCLRNDSINVTFIHLPELNLGMNSLYCQTDTVLILGPSGAGYYLWSNGSEDSFLYTNESGEYWLEIGDSVCFHRDTVQITINGNFSEFEISNVFTPNSDGFNDEFVAGSPSLETYSIKIYNRWGEIVFSTNEPGKYWNGKIKNIDAPEGTYFWYCNYYDNCNGKTEEKRGTVTLLR